MYKLSSLEIDGVILICCIIISYDINHWKYIYLFTIGEAMFSNIDDCEA